MSNNLEYYRVQVRGISQRELAELSGISTVTICSFENGGVVTPRNKTMKAIAAALGQPVADVFPNDTVTLEKKPRMSYDKKTLLNKWRKFCDQPQSSEIYHYGKSFIERLFTRG